MIKKKSRLPLEERKYCSCLAKVRPKVCLWFKKNKT